MADTPRRASSAAAALLALALGEGAFAMPQATFTASRGEACAAPCAVFFDATATLDPRVARPFHELDFAWDFGDDQGELWPVSGREKNRAVGGVAGHLFVRPGVHSVVLAVTNALGESARATRTITVSDPERVFAGQRTTCVSTSGDFEGCPPEARRTTSGEFDASIANADGHRTLFRRGETFRWKRPLRLADASQTGAAIGAFGAGAARPVVRAEGPVAIDPGHDWRVAQLALFGPGSGFRIAAFQDHDGVRRFTVYDVEVHAFDYCADFWSPKLPNEQVAFVEVRCLDFPDPGDGAKLLEDTQQSMFLGLEIDKGDKRHPEDRTEFAHRSVFTYKKVIQHSLYHGHAPNQGKNVLQLRHCPDVKLWAARCRDGASPGRYVIVSDNHFIEEGGPHALSVIRVCDHSACNGLPGASQPVGDYLFERNLIQLRFRDPARATLLAVFQIQGSNITIRNNVADLQGWPSGGPARAAFVLAVPPSNPERDPAGEIHVLHNTVYLGEGFGGSAVLCGAPAGSGHRCANNLLYAPGLAGERKVVLMGAFDAEGNLLDGAASPGRYLGNPFAGPPPPPLSATLPGLRAFLPAVRVEGGTAPLDGARAGGSVDGGWVARDALSNCRRGAPDVGALEGSGVPCQGVAAAGAPGS